jgi:hypothetical protein
MVRFLLVGSPRSILFNWIDFFRISGLLHQRMRCRGIFSFFTTFTSQLGTGSILKRCAYCS